MYTLSIYFKVFRGWVVWTRFFVGKARGGVDGWKGKCQRGTRVLIRNCSSTRVCVHVYELRNKIAQVFLIDKLTLLSHPVSYPINVGAPCKWEKMRESEDTVRIQNRINELCTVLALENRSHHFFFFSLLFSEKSNGRMWFFSPLSALGSGGGRSHIQIPCFFVFFCFPFLFCPGCNK